MGSKSRANDHASCVAAWRRRVAADGSPAALLRAFERGFRAVWRRAHVTLGDITLTAIGDRILHDAADVYPLLGSVRLEPTGISCDALDRDAALDRDELGEAMEMVLVDFLTVVGRLTGDVLTPALHAELDADCDADEGSGP